MGCFHYLIFGRHDSSKYSEKWPRISHRQGVLHTVMSTLPPHLHAVDVGHEAIPPWVPRRGLAMYNVDEGN